MCFACEMAFFLAMEDGIPPSTGTASHDQPSADDAARFSCDAPENEPVLAAALPTQDESKP
jgi:hypothetical protein